MSTNPLDRHPKAREYAYLAQWTINGILGVIGVVLTGLGLSPAWYVLTTAVFNFVWTYTGITAKANVVPGQVLEVHDEPYRAPVEEATPYTNDPQRRGDPDDAA